MGSRPLRLTTHAAQRSRQRVGSPPALAGAVRLPKSAFGRFRSWGGSSRVEGRQLWCTMWTVTAVVVVTTWVLLEVVSG